MSTRISLLTILIICTVLINACSKSGTAPIPVVPPPVIPPVLPPIGRVDTLGAWTKMSGPKAGIVLTDIFFTSASTGFVSAADSNIYNSQDGGNTWHSVLHETNGATDNLFFLDAQHGFAEGPNYVDFTEDGGSTWKYKPLQIHSLATYIYFTTPAIGYVSIFRNGVFKTLDTGTSWTRATISKFPNSDNYSPFFLDAQTGYIVSNTGGGASSVDAGDSWTSFPTDLPKTSIEPVFNQLQFLNQNTGYYACDRGVFKTINGGQNWINLLSMANSNVNVVKFFDASTGYYKADSSIYKTIDGGQSWSVSCRLVNEQLLGMYFLNQTTGWACTSLGNVLRLQ